MAEKNFLQAILLKMVDLMGTLNRDELFLLCNEMSVLSDESYKKADGKGNLYAIASAMCIKEGE